jgi:hypothetical protein
MVKLSKFQRDSDQHFNPLEVESDFAEAPVFQTSPFQTPDSSGFAIAASQPPTCVRINLEGLHCFEVVDQQFQQWGVTFSNAIALQPSNPAFPPRTGKTVLMGSPKDGWVEAKFEFPVQSVAGFVTSSRRTVLLAYDADDQPVARTESPGANLAGSSSLIPANVQLSLKASNIHRVMFQTFDGQFTLDDFSFSY